jgi:hypothetical protein
LSFRGNREINYPSLFFLMPEITLAFMLFATAKSKCYSNPGFGGLQGAFG